jgi:hypothetical protein
MKLKADFTHKDMREVFLSDPTADLVKLTLWGKDAINFDTAMIHKVVAIKGALVKVFNGNFQS